ncbi:hypothetical protein BDY17DRAFT_289152 [Neohortaea acidophila]|uniref:Transmembrane protein 135 N-terminal domain-containing protein n=1 Tax=Neohortaea acidophila TaxID=245834 RepID=A0A6A6Q571_9PEZI|nr:uncharacterized protein BDY17DRAFT_289152 [Neohortaea acidophila]KAF2487530.1 hypothetical protein BDY17DRAFT_289152 [Neohortaea acidophila]
MSSPSSSTSGGSGRRNRSPPRPLDPISRTALRYTLSPREYELLHQYLISRAPAGIQKHTPSPRRFEKITGQRDQRASSTRRGSEPINSEEVRLDDNVQALRAALRVFVGVYLGFKGYGVLMRKLAERRGARRVESTAVRFGDARLALSFSSILLFHKLLHRFFHRLRASLLDDNAVAFRKRNPQIARLLTSAYTPSVGAALAGGFLGVSPADQLRITIAIYVFTRSLEFGYNALEEGGYLWKSEEDGGSGRPWWFGSWMIMPFACGQLLHAFVFDRSCFPADYGKFIMQRSPEYIQLRPKDYARDRPWPGTFDIVDALAAISKLNWPPFLSPILFPGAKEALPAQLEKVAPLTSPAHPATAFTSCAVLHPHDPSCLRTYIKYFVRAFPGIVRFFTLIYGAFALLAYKSLLKDPKTFLNRLSARILRMALFITGAIGSSWASICFFNIYLPRSLLPTQRWFFGGFIGGLWAFVARSKERGNFLYSARLSIDSLYKVGKKRHWWKGIKNGDVLLFVASLALLNVVYEARPGAVQGAMMRKGMGVLRGEGFTDRAEPKGQNDKEKMERKEAEEEALGEKMKDE